MIGECFILSCKKNGIKIFEKKGIIIDKDKCIPIEIKNEIEKFFLEFWDDKRILTKFQPYINEGLKILLNNKESSLQLANYINYCLIENFRRKSKEKINEEFELIISDLKLLIDRYIFKEIIVKQMNERVIRDISLSLEDEKMFVLKLNEEMNNNNIYIIKMKAMINEIEQSKNRSSLFNGLNINYTPNNIKFNVIVLTGHIWDINIYQRRIKLPILFPKVIKLYEKLYKEKYKYKLNWLHDLSSLEIKYLSFKKIDYISKSSYIQYLILLQIEKYKKLSLKKISQLLGVKIDLIINEISGLIFNPSFNPNNKKDKGLLLGNFDEKSQSFKETDEFWFNFNFYCTYSRFNTIPLNIKTENQIKEEEKNNIENHEKYVIQSTLARIMKLNKGKKVAHNYLINEVLKKIDFFPQNSQIKDNIEKLIKQNIIKRSFNDKSCYEYIP